MLVDRNPGLFQTREIIVWQFSTFADVVGGAYETIVAQGVYLRPGKLQFRAERMPRIDMVYVRLISS